jgi:regulator of protease activity HflC (stomatin/prohibitin superfamily)
MMLFLDNLPIQLGAYHPLGTNNIVLNRALVQIVEIAVENKKRQIRETQMEAERAVQEKKHLVEKEALEANIGLEDRRKSLVALAAENAKAEADARAYGVSCTMKALGTADARILQALASTGMKPEQLIAFAFQELAGKADKIGQLNISPDLLRELLAPRANEK